MKPNQLAVLCAAPVLALLLTACESEPEIDLGETGGTAEGEVLGGTISDDMIALEQLTSQAPLAPREVAAPSAAAPPVTDEGEAPAAELPER